MAKGSMETAPISASFCQTFDFSLDGLSDDIDFHAACNVKRETPPRRPIATPFSSSIA